MGRGGGGGTGRIYVVGFGKDYSLISTIVLLLLLIFLVTKLQILFFSY